MAQLVAGDRLGPYEILAPIGAGGMGEVYKARDTRLGREVAIKVSAEKFSDRFEREARTIATFNHPNICTLHDVGPNYLVMELIEGPTLAEIIQTGALPLSDALAIAQQIKDALEAAHERGIVHRDLKPANIKVSEDGKVKVLDFGLAKATMSPAGASASNPEASPTISMAATQAGVILGTAAYMSPEQARGKVVDKRADIWAFGVVLYEMITGKRLFQGEDLTETLASVVKEEPRLDEAPAKVRRLLRKCLEKDPKKRLRDIGDAWELLEDVGQGHALPVPQAMAPRHQRWLWPGIAAALALAIAGLLFVHVREAPPTEPVSMQFQISAPAETQFATQMALSPDGRLLAFTAVSAADGTNSIWVRPLNSLEAKPLRQARTGQPFFWSSDSRFIVYNGNGKLTKIDVSGGPPQVICDAPNGVIGGFWTQDGTIVFGESAGELMRVSAGGGVPSPLTTLDPSGLNASMLPSLLPDGRHFLYFGGGSAQLNSGIFLTSLTSKPSEKKLLLYSAVGPAFAPSSDRASGHLLFLRDGTLMAQRFDLGSLALAGPAVPIAEDVGTSLAHGFFSVSNNGVLAYRTGTVGGTRLAWFDRMGKEIGQVGQPGDYRSVALSPDGARVAARIDARNLNIWLFDLARNTSTRFTSGQVPDNSPVWSRDGSRIAFFSGRATQALYVKTVSSDAKPEMLLPPALALTPWGWSPDGRFLLYSVLEAKTGKTHLWVLAMDGDRKPAPLMQTEFGETQAQFSPDGRWISYTSDESGRNEIYVRPFPVSAEGGKIKVSEGGGAFARWRQDGKELLYIGLDAKMMAVDVSAAASFKAGVPNPLFQTRMRLEGGLYQWDVSADGKRFLIDTLASERSDPITIVTNWQAGLPK